MISPEQLEPLKKTKIDIAERAKEYFSKQVEAIVSDAQKGNWNTCLERLKEAYTKVDSINGTESVYKKAEQDINAVRDKKAAEEKQKIADEIKAGDDLFTKRMYKQAYQKYAAVIAQISDIGQKNELEKKKRLIGLFAFAKKTVIEYIARKEGAALASGGNIKSVDEKQFIAVGEEGGTVNMQWHELKYMDFVGLLKQALAEKPDPKGYAIMGYMCLESGDKNGATTYFSQAIQISPEIKNTYPDLFRESMQRLKK
jgi:tetratricopeptide (TPR) repeat protein